jgi:hypothetical protein
MLFEPMHHACRVVNRGRAIVYSVPIFRVGDKNGFHTALQHAMDVLALLHFPKEFIAIVQARPIGE